MGKKSLGAETHLDCREEQIEQDMPLDSLLTSPVDESLSSSDASSVIDETTLKCMVAEWLSSDQLVFNRKGLPDNFFLGINAPQPLVAPASIMAIERTVLEDITQDAIAADEPFVPNGLDIVPWSPVFGSIALQVLAHHLQLREKCAKDAVNQVTTGQRSVEDTEYSFGSSMLGSQGLFDMQEMEPHPRPNSAPEELPSQMGSFLALPTVISASDPRIPLVDRVVRRSPRLNRSLEASEGAPHFRISYKPHKKHKTVKVEVLKIGEHEYRSTPIPIASLQSWGIACGLAPMELTDDALITAPSAPDIPNEDQNN